MTRNRLLLACCILLSCLSLYLWYDAHQLQQVPENQPSKSPQQDQDALLVSEKKARLGSLALNRRDFKEAEALLLEAQSNIRQHRGENNDNFAWVTKLLGRLYLWTDRYDQAESAIKTTLEIHTALHGAEHPTTINTLNDLGGFYVQKGDWDKARPILESIRSTYKLHLGEDHLIYAGSLNNIGWLELQIGHYDEAEPFIRQAMAIYRKRIGEENPLTADCYEKLARIRTAKGRYDDAEALFQRALAIEEKTADPNDSCIAQCLEGYAVLLRKVGNNTKAQSLESRLKAMRPNKVIQADYRPDAK